jgi:hypothetical protein
MKQHLIDHAEHRSVGADSQGQRDDCDQGEPGALSELAHCIAEILKQSGHSLLLTCTAELQLALIQGDTDHSARQ